MTEPRRQVPPPLLAPPGATADRDDCPHCLQIQPREVMSYCAECDEPVCSFCTSPPEHPDPTRCPDCTPRGLP